MYKTLKHRILDTKQVIDKIEKTNPAGSGIWKGKSRRDCGTVNSTCQYRSGWQGFLKTVHNSDWEPDEITQFDTTRDFVEPLKNIILKKDPQRINEINFNAKGKVSVSSHDIIINLGIDKENIRNEKKRILTNFVVFYAKMLWKMMSQNEKNAYKSVSRIIPPGFTQFKDSLKKNIVNKWKGARPENENASKFYEIIQKNTVGNYENRLIKIGKYKIFIQKDKPLKTYEREFWNQLSVEEQDKYSNLLN